MQKVQKATRDWFDRHEQLRCERFRDLWANRLDPVFTEIAPYYDQASQCASFGSWRILRRRFADTVVLREGDSLLDVCAGNLATIRLLQSRARENGFFALDRNLAMLCEGRKQAARRSTPIPCVVGDAHALPFPDDHFDAITLQFASRHLHLQKVLGEVLRVLRPGGRFYHMDLARPPTRLLERLYGGCVGFSMALVILLFGSSPETRRLKSYFFETQQAFYTVGQMTELLCLAGFRDVRGRSLFLGSVALHEGRKQ